MQEVDTKKIGDIVHARADFLVVEDPEKTSTWHLPVKVGGKPDRKLAGAAWAALFSKAGFRGNRYEGPMADEARKKLRALYKSEEWDMPTAEMDYDEMPTMMTPPPQMVKSFKDLLNAERAQEAATKAHELTYKLQLLIANIIAAEGDNKVSAIRGVMDEYLALVEAVLGSDTEPSMPEALTEFAESVDGIAFELIEAESVKDKRAPVVIDFQIIKPGPGNKANNNYYPRDMLERNAGVFVGADIFMTDHVDSERGERTKVGKIREVVGFTDDGAPIGRAILFDPDVAEKARNRNAAGELGTLECSIYARGKAQPGKVGGKDFNVVSAIEEVKSVDLVSKAGAGGMALRLIENENGGDSIVNENDIQESVEVQQQEVVIEEAQPEPCKFLESSAVESILALTHLPEIAKARIASSEYASVDALTEAIKKETEYIKSVGGGGRVFGMGESQRKPTKPKTLAEIQEAQDAVNKRWLG